MHYRMLASLASTKFSSISSHDSNRQSLRSLHTFQTPLGAGTTPGWVHWATGCGGFDAGLPPVGTALSSLLCSLMYSSSKKSQHCQDYSGLRCVPSLAWRGWGHSPGPVCLPTIRPQPALVCPVSCQEHFLCVPQGSLRERARHLLFIYMGITGDQKSALK